MKLFSFSSVLSLSLAMGILGIGTLGAQNAAPKIDPNAKVSIVLVHGAWADGSSWQFVIPQLQKAGYKVVAVQNNLSSFADDVATTRRVLEAQTGPVVAVGHSYGGAVITAAAAGNTNVKALVYISAFAPDVGETIGDLNQKFGKSPLNDALFPDSAGFLFVNPEKFQAVVAADLPKETTAVLAATQRPIAGVLFGATVDSPAWKSIRSWYLITQDDQAVLPDLQRFMAKRMGATTREIKASHLSILSKPKDVAAIILEAARSPN
jgi:pimeloyl-ACP methyl ester carboxylesterase